jgi:hypothetical protein
MADKADIMVLGTGSFAARIVFDLAATAVQPVSVVIAGRNIERLAWFRSAANARAVIFGCPATFVSRAVDLSAPDAAAELIGEYRPSVLVQAASSQPASVISTQGDAWSELVAAGGLSATAVFQAQLSARVAKAVKAVHPHCKFINCCFPDVVNSLIAACDLPIACGVGNIGILSNAFAGELERRDPGALRMIAHYQTIQPWRQPVAARRGPVPRVWLDDEEISDVLGTFASVHITREPAVEISGASGIPLVLAMAAGSDWRGHVPGPRGLPGGYPVAYGNGELTLDLPPGFTESEAVAWNAAFEEKNGLVIRAGKARYTGVLHDRLRMASPALAEGFDVNNLEEVYTEMVRLRAALQARPARS